MARKAPARKTAQKSVPPVSPAIGQVSDHEPPTPYFNNIPPSQRSRPKNPSTILVILLIGLAFLCGYLFSKVKSLEQGVATGGAGTQQAAQQPATQVKEDDVRKVFGNKEFISFGDPKSKVVFLEVSDPSCPYCHVAGGHNPELSTQIGTQFQYASQGGSYVPPVPEMRKLVEEGKAAFAIIYSNGHSNGRLAMEALYCAHEKGKFWEAHDLLMTNAGYTLINETVQNTRENAPQLAQLLAPAVDSAFLTQCLSSAKYDKTLTRDEQLSPSLGFGGTPTFVVNSTVFNGAYNWNDIKPEVTKLLE